MPVVRPPAPAPAPRRALRSARSRPRRRHLTRRPPSPSGPSTRCRTRWRPSRRLSAQLHTTYPWLTVKFVPDKDDAAFAKAVAAGVPRTSSSPAPRTTSESSATTARSRHWTPTSRPPRWMSPTTFPAATLVYTQYRASSARCRLLADAYALVLQQEDVRGGGDHRAAQDAVRADRRREEAHGQEQRTARSRRSVSSRARTTTTTRRSTSASQSGTKYYDAHGKATFASDAQVGAAAAVGQGPQRLVRRGQRPEVRRHATSRTPTTRRTRCSPARSRWRSTASGTSARSPTTKTELRLRRRSRAGAGRRRRAPTARATPWAPSPTCRRLQAQAGGLLRPPAADHRHRRS